MNAVSGLLTSAPTSSPVLADSGSLDKTKPGLVAFLIILVMGLALWALLKNMGKQLGRAKEHFEAEDAALAASAASASPAPEVGKAESVAEVPKQDGAKGPKAKESKAGDPKKDAAGE
ncbi:MAG: hypothetical protein HOW97_15470 [Catenulispora sp.]|nr:hypothetical protein [Catenulispora sp.]